MNKIRSTAKDGMLRLAVFMLVGLAVAAVTGRLAAITVNDTPSYVDFPFDSLSDSLLSIRTPGYPVFLALVRSTLGMPWVPILHIVLHAVASWALAEELLRRKMPLVPALIAAACVLLGCTAADNVATVATDAPAASLGVLTATTLMRASRSGQFTDSVWCAVFAIVTIFVRPAYLALIPWIAVAGWLLRYQQEITDRTGRSRYFAFPIAAMVLAVVVGWMGIRKAVVDDFAIAPFGHQNLSAVLVQTVPASTLETLPGDANALGKRVADQLQRDGYALPGDIGRGLPTMTIEEQWGQINYFVVWPAARAIESERPSVAGDPPEAVRVHRRIGAFNKAILSAAPSGYLRWLLLAARRAVWGTAANIAMHPIFLALLLFVAGRLVFRCVTQPELNPIRFPSGWQTLAVVAVTYAVFNIGFVILSSPPIGRFADAGAIFLPGLLACLLFLSPQSDDVDCDPVDNRSAPDA